MNDLIPKLIDITREAAEEALKIYNTADFGIEHKEDKTPLTEADRRSNIVITEGLEKLHSDIPVISEENQSIPYKERKNWDRFWLVDPLDGTKEFIKRNGEFTINIALMEDGHPVLGVVSAPVKGIIYYGMKGEGAFGLPAGGGQQEKIHVPSAPDIERIKAVASRSHFSEKAKLLMEALDAEMINAGSSLKFVTVAKGEADFYPRFGPTHEWDTAAGHAIAEAAGAVVCGLDGQPLSYNKEDLRHNGFLVSNPRIKDRVVKEIAKVLKS
jgi:3'(2'), 5'-bisphosphate nucleotidase